MTPRQIYEMPAERADKELSCLVGCYYNHIPEVGDHWGDWLWGFKQDRVEIKYIKDFYYDGRRIWRLATVWFDGNPIMIIQNAGREGDDHRAKFVTDLDGYIKMVGYIASLLPNEYRESVKTVSIEDDLPELTEFYGQRLDDPFHRHTY